MLNDILDNAESYLKASDILEKKQRVYRFYKFTLSNLPCIQLRALFKNAIETLPAQKEN